MHVVDGYGDALCNDEGCKAADLQDKAGAMVPVGVNRTETVRKRNGLGGSLTPSSRAWDCQHPQ